MKCWKCGADEADPFGGKLPFRAVCETCGVELHCCVNCVFYFPGKPNDCAVPGTGYVADRTAANLCEEFKLFGKGPSKAVDLSDIAKRLFGDDLPAKDKDSKKRFSSLFDSDEF
jgi:hypothetical protein